MSIVIENLSFAYGDRQVLDNINLLVVTGETIGIAGISGGGKSTLLKLISGLYNVQSGKITIGDAQTSPERRSCVAMVMQNAMLLPASIRDNKMHELTEEERAWLLVKMVCVEDLHGQSLLSEAIWL